MSELLDPDGIWDLELVQLMLPVAIQIATEESAMQFAATVSAISGLFNKGQSHRDFQRRLKSVIVGVQKEQLRQRGIDPAEVGTAITGQGTDWLSKLARHLGVEPPEDPKTPKPPPKRSWDSGPTKVHGG